MFNPSIPVVLFVVLLVVWRKDLGFAKVAIFGSFAAAAFLFFSMLEIPMYYFTALAALLDAVIILIVYGHDIRLP